MKRFWIGAGQAKKWAECQFCQLLAKSRQVERLSLSGGHFYELKWYPLLWLLCLIFSRVCRWQVKISWKALKTNDETFPLRFPRQILWSVYKLSASSAVTAANADLVFVMSLSISHHFPPTLTRQNFIITCRGKKVKLQGRGGIH